MTSRFYCHKYNGNVCLTKAPQPKYDYTWSKNTHFAWSIIELKVDKPTKVRHVSVTPG